VEGSLGDGTPDDHYTPAPVVGISDAIEISAGDAQTCALRAAGEVWCWGANDQHQVTSADVLYFPLPVLVPGLIDAVEVHADVSSTCARHSDGRVTCWGAFTGSPAVYSEVSSAAQLAGHCVRLRSGCVRCRGPNAVGELGIGTAGRDSSDAFVTVTGINDALVAARGRRHACVIEAVGARTLYCWGSDDSGQLGDGDAAHACPNASPEDNFCSASPVPVAALGEPTDLALGGENSCALLSTGRVACWGDNYAGQLGTGVGARWVESPVEIEGLGNVVEVAFGYSHACVRTAAGQVLCWGNNTNGQLGNGETLSRSSPALVRFP